MAETLTAHHGHHVIGADWNAEPSELEAIEWTPKISGQIIFAEGNGTCRGQQHKWNTLDYFVFSEELAGVLLKVHTCTDIPSNPHVPVCAELHPAPEHLFKWELGEAPLLNKDQPLPPLPWSPIAYTVAGWLALEAAAGARRPEAPLIIIQQVITSCYASWIRDAEIEVAEQTGSRLPPNTPTLRTNTPMLMKVPALSPFVHKADNYGNPNLKAWRWMRDRVDTIPVDLAGLKTWASTFSNRPGWWPQELEPPADEGWLLAFEETLEFNHEERTHQVELTQATIQAKCEQVIPVLIKQAASKANKDWSEWAKLTMEGSASIGHKILKIPQAWTATTVLIRGQSTATPAALVQAQRELWARLWAATSEPPQDQLNPHDFQGRCQPLVQLTPAAIRKAAKGFKTKTSKGPPNTTD